MGPRTKLALALLVTIGACIRPDLVACGDLSCPRGSMCVNDSLCASPDQLAACEGMADGTICHAATGDGNCTQGVCAPSVCGDGMVTGLEQCDGDALPVGCTDLGYYSGTLSCTQYCSLDRSGCVGRCGDGIVQTNDGELCDGAAPSGSCMDYGEDVGALACNAGCGIGLSDCGRLSWSPALSVESSVIAITGAHGWLAFVDAGGHAHVVHDHAGSEHDGAFTAIAVADSSVWAVGPTTVAQWTLANGWVDSTPPWSAEDTIVSAWASDALGLWVSVQDTAPIWQLVAGNWTQEAGIWTQPAVLQPTRSSVIVATELGFKELEGSAWVAFDGPATTFAVAEDDQGRVWTISDLVTYPPDMMPPGGPPSGATLSRRSNGVWSQIDLGAGFQYISLAPSEGGMFVSYETIESVGQPGGGPITTAFPALVATGVAPFSTLWPGGPLDSPGLASDGRSPFAIESAAPVQTLDGQWVARGTSYETAFTHLTGGPLAFTQDDLSMTVLDELGNWNLVTAPATSCAPFAVSATGNIYCYDGTNLWDGATAIAMAPPNVLWASGDDSAAIAVGANLFAYRTAGAWTVTNPAISFTEIGGASFTDLYAIASTVSGMPALWHFDGTTWTAVTGVDPGMSSLVVGTTRVYSLDRNGLQSFDRATGVSSYVAVPVMFSQISGDRDDQLFGVAQTASPSTLWYFDGTSVSPVRAPSVADGVFAYGDQLIVLTDAQVHDGPPDQVLISRLARAGSW